MTDSMGPVAVAEPPGAEPLFTRMWMPPSVWAASATMRSTWSLLVTSATRGRMRRFVSAASSRAAASRVPCCGRRCDVDAFAGQFPGDGFADASAAAGHDRVLALQAEVHGGFSRGGVGAVLLVRSIVLREGQRRKGWASASRTGTAATGHTRHLSRYCSAPRRAAEGLP